MVWGCSIPARKRVSVILRSEATKNPKPLLDCCVCTDKRDSQSHRIGDLMWVRPEAERYKFLGFFTALGMTMRARTPGVMGQRQRGDAAYREPGDSEAAGRATRTLLMRLPRVVITRMFSPLTCASSPGMGTLPSW